MGSMSVAHWGLILIAAFLLLGRRRFSSLMAQFGEGLGSFKKGLLESPSAVGAESLDAAPPFVESDPAISMSEP